MIPIQVIGWMVIAMYSAILSDFYCLSLLTLAARFSERIKFL